jgi:hypothetical protein
MELVHDVLVMVEVCLLFDCQLYINSTCSYFFPENDKKLSLHPLG